MNRLLVIGPLPIKKYNVYCGTTVLMENFINFLDKNSIPYCFLQTNKFYSKLRQKYLTVLNAIYFMLLYVPMLLVTDGVMFNFSNRSLIKIVPLATSIAKLFHKKVIIRKFAGSPSLFWNQISRSKQKRILESFYKSDLVLLETKNGINFLNSITEKHINVQWFTNVRPPVLNEFVEKSRKPTKFVFISLVTKTKGIDEILALSNILPENLIIDIYGRIENHEYDEDSFKTCKNIRYLGALSNTEVVATLQKYDVLVLPSYSEGYPGIIVEAFSVGLPVIATQCGGVPEIVTESFNGYLIPTKSSSALYNSIIKIASSPDTYSVLSQNAYNTYNRYFNSDIVNEKIFKLINSL